MPFASDSRCYRFDVHFLSIPGLWKVNDKNPVPQSCADLRGVYKWRKIEDPKDSVSAIRSGSFSILFVFVRCALSGNRQVEWFHNHLDILAAKARHLRQNDIVAIRLGDVHRNRT